MEKTALMKIDGAGAVYGSIKVARLSMEIKDSCVTLVKSAQPDVTEAVMSGEVVPHSGTIFLAGVNITERNKNERRVAVMPQDLTSRDADKLLHDALCEKTHDPNVSEVRKSQLEEKIRSLKKQLHSSEKGTAASADLKQAQIDLTALGFKMKRRQTELELNVKAAKALLDSVRKTSPAYVKNLENKLFSAQLELSSYLHKALPESVIKARIQSVKIDLGLSDASTDIELAFACAYAKAPVLILCSEISQSELDILHGLCEKTGMSVACISADDTGLSCDETVEVTAVFTAV